MFWVLLASAVGLLSYYVHRKWQYFKKLNIPHDPPSVLKFGHLAMSIGKEKCFEWDNEQKKKHGPVWGYFTFLTPLISIHDPDILRQIFIKEFSNFPDRQKRLLKINGKELNTGLNVVQGDQWKRIRTTMTPTFSTSKLKQMVGIIDWCAGNAIKAFERKLQNGDGTFNAKTSHFDTAFSTNADSQNDTVKESEIAKQAKDLFSGSLFKPLILLSLLFPPFEKVIEKLNITAFGSAQIQYFKSLAVEIINKRNSEDPHHKGRVDLMQLMLDAEIPESEAKAGADKGMTKTEIVGNSMFMILAGYENTGNQMRFLAYNLAQHPKIQEDVQREIDKMMEKHGRFDYETVNSLKLLDMCVNETLRLYFPLLRNARISESEITINGVTIPKGIQVSIPCYGLAHDPEYWDQPYEFIPERMRDMSQIDPMMFQPFGAGPRNCIGMRFALMEIKLSLAKILHNFSFAPAKDTPKPPLKMAFRLSVQSAVDYDLRIVPRKKVE